MSPSPGEIAKIWKVSKMPIKYDLPIPKREVKAKTQETHPHIPNRIKRALPVQSLIPIQSKRIFQMESRFPRKNFT